MTRIEANKIRERLALIFMVSVVGILVVAYVYFLNITIAHGISVEKNSKELGMLSATVSELESEYFEVKNVVTLALAKDLGFSDAGSQLYISRKGEVLTLSLQNEN